MDKIKVYLDNCCFNRPFDDQSQLKIHLETQAKLFIQQKILQGDFSLVWSYILEYENMQNPFEMRRSSIIQWKDLAVEHIVESEAIITFAETLSVKEIKAKDALHIACAYVSKCDYFFTTDKKLLNTPVNGLAIIDPLELVTKLEVE